MDNLHKAYTYIDKLNKIFSITLDSKDSIPDWQNPHLFSKHLEQDVYTPQPISGLGLDTGEFKSAS